MWIAGKRMKIKRDGGYVWVDPGDPVPEAKFWPNRSPWIRGGFIRESRRVHQAETDEALASKKAPALSAKPAPFARPVPVVKPAAKPESKPDAGAKPKTTRAPKQKQPKPRRLRLKGKGECPYCKKDFIQLERHTCKKAPR